MIFRNKFRKNTCSNFLQKNSINVYLKTLEHLYKWEDMLIPQIRKHNFPKMSLLIQGIYRFNESPIEIPK